MSKTYRDNDARMARKLGRAARNAFNSGDADLSRHIYQEMVDLEVDGVRYGNHRKMMAKEKVIQRRADRRSKKVSMEDLEFA